MLGSEVSSNPLVSLANKPATVQQRQFALVVAVLLFVGLAVAAPFADTPLISGGSCCHPNSAGDDLRQRSGHVDNIIRAVLDCPITRLFSSRQRLSFYGVDRDSTGAYLSGRVCARRPSWRRPPDPCMALRLLASWIACCHARLRMPEG
jgi:hypothetical protein